MKIQVEGTVVKGYGVASGIGGDLRFPAGTIEMQKPIFREHGLDLSHLYSGTLNISIDPYRFRIKQASYTFKQIKWSATDPPEDFSFLECCLILPKRDRVSGLIYYPHPETKPEHYQPPEILEVMMPYIEDLAYGERLILELEDEQIGIYL